MAEENKLSQSKSVNNKQKIKTKKSNRTRKYIRKAARELNEM